MVNLRFSTFQLLLSPQRFGLSESSILTSPGSQLIRIIPQLGYGPDLDVDITADVKACLFGEYRARLEDKNGTCVDSVVMGYGNGMDADSVNQVLMNLVPWLFS